MITKEAKQVVASMLERHGGFEHKVFWTPEEKQQLAALAKNAECTPAYLIKVVRSERGVVVARRRCQNGNISGGNNYYPNCGFHLAAIHLRGIKFCPGCGRRQES